jgi:sirohydrochlorin ferrochelatase
MPGVAAFVELASPLLTSVLESPEPSVVVPLLLSTGYHVREDLAVVAGRALGPDPLLAAAQVSRLGSTGACPGSPLVMVAAGSRDPLATRDLMLATALLSEAWGGPVRLATLGGLGRRPSDVVRPGDAVSPYLLAPGFFATRCLGESLAAGADMVADVIGPHDRVVDLVVERAAGLLAARRSA